MKLIKDYIKKLSIANINTLEQDKDKQNFIKYLQLIDDILKDTEYIQPTLKEGGRTKKEILNNRVNYLHTLAYKEFIRELRDDFETIYFNDIKEDLLKELPNQFYIEKYDFKNKLSYYLNDQITKSVFKNNKTNHIKLYKTYFLDYSINTNVKMNSFDKAIYNTVITFYKNGNRLFRTSDIYKYLIGNPKIDNCMLSKRNLKIIDDTLTKFKTTLINIDVDTKEYNFHGDPYLLDIRRLGYKNKLSKEEDTIIEFRSEPILLTIARNQILTAPIFIKNNSRFSIDLLSIEEYLKPIIICIKNKKLNDKILYKTILDNAELDNDTKGKNKAKINKILDSFVKNQFIKSYQKTRDYIKISTCWQCFITTNKRGKNYK